ncbi:MAG: hypothetical protein ACI8S6_000191 [Myxococcota bacterium]|jgi:hypothetical protein
MFLVIAAMVACSEPKTDTAEVDEESGSSFLVVPDCALLSPCEEVGFDDAPEPGKGDGYDPEEAACVVEALARGDEGLFSAKGSHGLGKYSERWTMQSLGDGTVLWSRTEYDDIDYEAEMSWRALPAASHFEGCSIDIAAAFIDCIEAIPSEACIHGEPDCQQE